MGETAGEHRTLPGTEYGSDGAATGDRMRGTARTAGDDETEVLIAGSAGNDRRLVGKRRAVVTVIVLTVVNLLNYMDRYTIAGESAGLPPY